MKKIKQPIKKKKKINYFKFTKGLLIFYIGLILTILSLMFTDIILLLSLLITYIGLMSHLILLGDKPYSKSKKFLKENKNYLYGAFFIFLFMSMIGFFFPVFFQKEILKMIQELVSKTQNLNALELTRFIFLNNLKSSFFALILGIVFGIFPIISIIINGYVLGFVANKTVSLEGILVLWRLLPHGIFEIPAIIISIGLGMNLGFFFFSQKEKLKAAFAYISSILIFIISLSIVLSVLLAIFIPNINFINPASDIKTLKQNPTFETLLPLIIIFLFLIGIYISSFTFSKNQRKEIKKNLKKEIINSLRTFITIVIPLLIIAAIIEGSLIFILG